MDVMTRCKTCAAVERDPRKSQRSLGILPVRESPFHALFETLRRAAPPIEADSWSGSPALNATSDENDGWTQA